MDEIARIHRHCCSEEALAGQPDACDKVAEASRQGKDDKKSEGDIRHIKAEGVAGQLAEEGVAWDEGIEDIG